MIKKLCEFIFTKTGILFPEKIMRLLLILFVLLFVLFASFIYRAFVLG